MQTDAISRSKLLKQFPLNMENPLWHFTGIRAAIEAAPALDVVPVVRCGDCRWYDSAFNVCSKCGVCVNHDFYCADGEKEENK